MADIIKTFKFEAAHQLPQHKGKCAREHGHSYMVDIIVHGPIIDPMRAESSAGMVLDFGDVSDVVKPAIEKYCDHYNLNETLGLPVTTAEMIGCWFIGLLWRSPLFWGSPETFIVRVQETETSMAEVSYNDWMDVGRPGPSLEEARELFGPLHTLGVRVVT